MNKLLRNRWLVGALVIGMAALWWVQMRGVLYAGGVASAEPVAVTAHEVPTGVGNEETNASDTIAIEPLSRLRAVAPTRLRWDSMPTRDPFAPIAVASSQVALTPVQATPVESIALESAEAVPALEAVLKTPSAQIAVIDGRIVRVGDKVSGRPVLRIDSASVALGGGSEATPPLVLKLPAR